MPPDSPPLIGDIDDWMYFTFSDEALRELRRHLGPHFDGAISGLQLAATLFAHQPDRRRDHVQRQRLKRFDYRLEAAQRALQAISAETLRDLAMASIDLEAHRRLTAGDGSVADDHAGTEEVAFAKVGLSELRGVVREALKRHETRRRARMGVFLAAGVAGSLLRVGVPVSISHDGVFARVVSTLWYEVRGTAPLDVFPYVKAGADIARRFDPSTRPAKGRPRKRYRHQ